MKKKPGRPKNKEIYEEFRNKKYNKNKIFPGKWSDRKVDFSLVAKLKKTDLSCFGLPPCLGKYITHDDGYSMDGYRAKVKIFVENVDEYFQQYGIDDVLAACEKSLNSYKNKAGRKILGDVVIMKLLYDEKNKIENYFPCMIKTNRKFIPQFLGLKKGILQVF